MFGYQHKPGNLVWVIPGTRFYKSIIILKNGFWQLDFIGGHMYVLDRTIVMLVDISEMSKELGRYIKILCGEGMWFIDVESLELRSPILAQSTVTEAE